MMNASSTLLQWESGPLNLWPEDMDPTFFCNLLFAFFSRFLAWACFSERGIDSSKPGGKDGPELVVIEVEGVFCLRRGLNLLLRRTFGEGGLGCVFWGIGLFFGLFETWFMDLDGDVYCLG